MILPKGMEPQIYSSEELIAIIIKLSQRVANIELGCLSISDNQNVLLPVYQNQINELKKRIKVLEDVQKK